MWRSNYRRLIYLFFLCSDYYSCLFYILPFFVYSCVTLNFAFPYCHVCSCYLSCFPFASITFILIKSHFYECHAWNGLCFRPPVSIHFASTCTHGCALTLVCAACTFIVLTFCFSFCGQCILCAYIHRGQNLESRCLAPSTLFGTWNISPGWIK